MRVEDGEGVVGWEGRPQSTLLRTWSCGGGLWGVRVEDGEGVVGREGRPQSALLRTWSCGGGLWGVRVEDGEGVVGREGRLAERRDEGVAWGRQAEAAAQTRVRLLALEQRLRGALVRTDRRTPPHRQQAGERRDNKH